MLFTIQYEAIPHWKGEKNTLSKKKYFGRRKPMIFRHKKIKKHILHKNF